MPQAGSLHNTHCPTVLEAEGQDQGFDRISFLGGPPWLVEGDPLATSSRLSLSDG